MQTYTPIEAKHEEVEVIAYADARADRHLLKHVLRFEHRTRTVAVAAQRPHVACVEEQCAVEVAEHTRTILEVHLQLQVAGLVEIREVRSLGMIATRTDTAHVERTYAVGAAYIELLAVRCAYRIAIRPYNTHVHVSDERAVLRHLPRLAVVGLHFQKLSVRILEHRLLLVVPLLAERHVSERKQIGSLAHRHLPEDRIVKARRRLVCECVAHLRHKLVAHRHKQVRTLVDEIGEGGRHVLHVFVLQYERRELVLHDGSRLRLVCQLARHDVALEEARAVEHVERSLDERCRRGIALAYRLAFSATYMAQAAQDIVHKQQARHLYRHIGTIFVRVELRAAAVCLMSCLPFVRAFQIHGEFLAASEGVALH